jgi:hypothetical protein
VAQQLSEVEVLVEELETRVERLRALYEMYFMGIEKIEPAVPRKDVDRRFYVLRRTQLRNTALRYRFLNVLLRYNTYQSYWQRITRKIEEGTYKRDVRRANARFANVAPAKPKEREIELGDDDLEELHDAHDTDPPASREAPPEDPVAAALSRRGAELEDELSLDVDLDLGFATDDPFGPDSWLQQKEARAVLRPAPVPKEAQPIPEAPRAKNPLEVMPTQREIWIGKRPAAPSKERVTSRPPSPSRPPKARPSTAPGPKAAPAAATARGGLRYAQGPQPKRSSEVPIPGRPPASAPAAGARSASAGPARKKSRPSMPKVELPKAANPARPASRSPPAAAARAASAGTAAGKSSLSDERVRQIYTKYVETKRSLKESTASLTFESLAKSLRDSSDKLSSKHTGKSVDFEVAVKDGRTILRPVVK